MQSLTKTMDFTPRDNVTFRCGDHSTFTLHIVGEAYLILSLTIIAFTAFHAYLSFNGQWIKIEAGRVPFLVVNDTPRINARDC